MARKVLNQLTKPYKMKLWIDDFRDAPDDSWTEVRKVEPAIRLLSMFTYTHISIDHDIEYRPDDETFKPIAHFIGMKYQRDFYVALSNEGGMIPVTDIVVHSDNPAGAKEIISILGDYGLQARWEPYTRDKDFREKYGL